MIRKTPLLLLGAAAGVAVTLIASHPRILLDGARAQGAAAKGAGRLCGKARAASSAVSASR
jgi:hypothetical protein